METPDVSLDLHCLLRPSGPVPMASQPWSDPFRAPANRAWFLSGSASLFDSPGPRRQSLGCRRAAPQRSHRSSAQGTGRSTALGTQVQSSPSTEGRNAIYVGSKSTSCAGATAAIEHRCWRLDVAEVEGALAGVRRLDDLLTGDVAKFVGTVRSDPRRRDQLTLTRLDPADTELWDLIVHPPPSTSVRSVRRQHACWLSW